MASMSEVIKKNLIIFFLIFLGAGITISNPLEDASKMIAEKKYDEAEKQLISIKYKFKGNNWEIKATKMLAGMYEKKRDYSSALLEYGDIAKKFPSSADAEEAMIAIARIKYDTNDKNAAIKAYSEYINKYPSGRLKVTALFNMAGIYKENNELSKALSLYDNIIKYHPDDLWFASWSAIYGGHIFRGSGEYDKAVQWYNRVPVSQNNEFMVTLAKINAAQTTLEKKDNKMAQEMFKRILEKKNYFMEEALFGLGNAYAASGDYALAREAYESLSVLYPKSQWAVPAEKKAKEMSELLKKPAE